MRGLNLDESLRYFYLTLLVMLLASTILFLMIGWQRVDAPYQLDYGEGPLLDRAVRIHNGENLPDIYRYPSTYPYSIVNYPPLLFLSLAPFINADDPTYATGRLLSIVCGIITAINIFLIVYKFTNNGYAALISALLLLASPIIIDWSSMLRVDAMALALSTSGLAVLLYWPDRSIGLLLSIMLIVAAAYTRQAYVFCAPLAGFAFLSYYSLRRATLFIGLIGVIGLSIFFIINHLTNNNFWFHVGAIYLSGGTPEPWAVLLFEKWPYAIYNIGPILIGCIGFYFWRGTTNRFVWAYILGSVVALIGMTKSGANLNYMLELYVVLVLIVGILIDKALQRQLHVWQAQLLFAALIVQVGIFNYQSISLHWIPYNEQVVRAEEWRLMKDKVQVTGGNVLTDTEMGLFAQQGYPILFEPFDFSQMSRHGRWDQTQIVQDIEMQTFDLIIIQNISEYVIRERWTDEMLQAVDNAYILDDTWHCCRVYYPR